MIIVKYVYSGLKYVNQYVNEVKLENEVCNT